MRTKQILNYNPGPKRSDIVHGRSYYDISSSFVNSAQFGGINNLKHVNNMNHRNLVIGNRRDEKEIHDFNNLEKNTYSPIPYCEEDTVDVESKYIGKKLGIRKRIRKPKNSWKIIVARELLKRFINMGDYRSLTELGYVSKNMTREERYSLFSVSLSFINNNQNNDDTSIRKDMIIPVIFGMAVNICDNEEEDINEF